MTAQLNMLGVDERVKVYVNKSCLCHGSLGCSCWAARCVACKEPLTKHAFSEDDARSEAIDALDRPHHFQHVCKAAA